MPALFLLLLLLVGCPGGPITNPFQSQSPQASLKILAGKTTILVGEALQLSFSAVQTTPDGSSISWSSSDGTVASISDTGLVKGLKAGTSTMTAKLGASTATLDIKVSDGNPEDLARVATITVTPGSMTLNSVGDVIQFAASAADSEGTLISNIPFTWKSSNTQVATINGNGEVTVVGVGITDITASAGSATSSPSTLTIPGGTVDMNVIFQLP